MFHKQVIKSEAADWVQVKAARLAWFFTSWRLRGADSGGSGWLIITVLLMPQILLQLNPLPLLSVRPQNRADLYIYKKLQIVDFFCVWVCVRDISLPKTSTHSAIGIAFSINRLFIWSRKCQKRKSEMSVRTSLKPWRCLKHCFVRLSVHNPKIFSLRRRKRS